MALDTLEPQKDEEKNPVKNPSQEFSDDLFDWEKAEEQLQQATTPDELAAQDQRDDAVRSSNSEEKDGGDKKKKKKPKAGSLHGSELGNLMEQAGFKPEEQSLNFTGEGKENQSKSKKFLGKFASRRVRAGLVGGVISAGVAALLVGWGLIGNFKLEHLFQNVDRTSFAKFNSAFERRSDKWFQAYIRIRLTEYREGGSDDPLYFRSRRVDTNSPIRDWYHSIRTSKFEANLAEKGIVFTSSYDDATGRVNFHQLKLCNGECVKDGVIDQGQLDRARNIATSGEFNGRILRSGDLDDFLNENVDKINRELSQNFDNDRDARRAIKTVVNDETKSWQWFKRRRLRSNIQNMTGVRSWRFFETTRDRVDQKKDSLKRKLINMLVPESTKSGKFLTCLLGTSKCNSGTDANNPENQSGATDADLNGDRSPDDGVETTTVNEDGTETTTRTDTESIDGQAKDATSDTFAREAAEDATEEAAEDAAKAGLKGAFIRQLLNKFNTASGLVAIADNIKRVHNNIEDGALIKVVVAAKTAQVIANYSTYHTISDQAKEGDLARTAFGFASENPDEFNEIMKNLNGLEKSEMYDAFFPSPDTTSFFGASAFAQGSTGSSTSELPSRSEYCSDDHVPSDDDYHYLCAETKVGGRSNAQAFTEAYEDSVGKIIGPFVEAYSSIRDAPILGDVIDFGLGISNAIGDAIGAAIQPVLEATGLNNVIEDALGWIMNKLLIIAGAGPLSDGTEPGGYQFNLVGQGGVATESTSTRQVGGSLSTPESEGYLRKLYAQQHADKLASMPLKDRFLATENPDSLAHRSLFAINTSSTPRSGIMTALNPLGRTVAAVDNSVGTVFGGSSYALAGVNSKPAEVSGIVQNDIPPQCIEADPLTDMQTPADGTNADEEIEGLNADDLTWENVRDQKAFWELVYQKIGDADNPDSITENIYNCHTFDEAVRESMGKGYEEISTEDDILGTGGTSTGTSPYTGPDQDTSGLACPTGTDDGGVHQDYGPGRVPTVKIRICGIPGSIPAERGVNASIAQAAKDMIAAAKNSGGLNLSGSAFRSYDRQKELRIAHGCPDDSTSASSCRPPTAKPGTSRHELGVAIDFSSCSSSSRCFNWLSANAANYGFFNLPSESWHWSVDGS